MRLSKVERFSANLICGGGFSHIFGPFPLNFFSPKLTWFGFIASRFRTCCLGVALFEDDN